MLFGSNLWDDIYDSFKNLYDKGLSTEYLDSAYNSEYPKDPFIDTLNNLDGMQKQVKVAWAQYIEEELKSNNCNLSKKQIWWILYYFVPEFRAEIASGLKKEWWHKNSKEMVLDESTIKKYCEDYYVCKQKKDKGNEEKTRKDIIKSPNPWDVMTNCKEYFRNAYAKWSANEKRMQCVNNVWAWNDKFWNATTDDSPYDIMLDLNNIGVFMYEETNEPITPVFYNLPVFSNSAQSLLNNMNFGIWWWSWWNGGNSAWTSVWWSVWWKGGNSAWASVWGGAWWSVWWKGGNIAWTNVWWSVWWKGGVSIWFVNKDSGSVDKSSVQVSDGVRNSLWNNNEWSQKNEETIDKKRIEEQKSGDTLVAGENLSSEGISDVYDDLVDGLWTRSLVDKWTLFYGSLCKDEETEVEPEWTTEIVYGWITNDTVMDWEKDSQILSKEEYQEMVDYMLGAVDQYSALPEEIQASILEFVAALDNVNPEWWYNAPATPDTSDEAVSQIKSCVGSCKWLRMDQYLSCVEMCACGERTSKVFDPEWNSGLWPIAKIKFCTVPGMDMSFNEGGRNIVSIEAWGKEILWAVDKLSREWKLWIWTKQTNFLDSSTKKMKIGKIISFSISVEGIDISKKTGKSSKQYEEKVLKEENESLQSVYSIKNLLNDPSRKNQFCMWCMWEDDVSQTDDGSSSNGDDENCSSQVGDSHADRYVSTSQDLNTFLEEQASYWKSMLEIMNDMTSDSDALFSKKK